MLQGNRNGRRLMKLIMALLIGLLITSGGWVPAPKAYASADYPILGEIKLFPYAHPPDGWQRADGRILNIAGNDALFYVLGSRFGGNGTSTFALPDLRGLEKVPGVSYYIATEGYFPLGGIPMDGVMISEVKLFAFDYTGSGMLPAQNQTLNVTTNQPLYSIIGHSYGGSPGTTFKLPNLAPLAPGVNYYIATSGVFPNGNYSALYPYVGEIVMFPNAVNSALVGIERADGGLLNIMQNTPLFALLGTNFGGDGRSTFGKPNFSTDPTLLYGIALSGVYPPQDWDEVVTNPDNYTVPSNSVLTVTGSGVLANDTNASSAILVTGPQHGTLTLNADGSFVYTPSAGFTGTDVFKYKSSAQSNVADVTITVQAPVQTVAFNSNGGTAVSTQNVSQGAYAVKPADPTKPGHTFAGWYADSGLATPFDFTGTAITGNITLYAKWTVNSYTVTFNINGGTSIADQTVSYGGKATKPVTDPTKLGHTFAGWYADSGLVTPFDFAATTITGNTTIYAKWTANPYTVAFNSDGGSSIADQTVSYGGKATKPITDPTKPGHTFAGWYADSGLVTPFDFAATTITGNTTAYAKWTMNQYTVAFNTDGGTAEANQTVNYNAKATKPVADPTKAGHAFAGWYTNSALTTPFDFSATAIQSNTTVYAKWTINQYTVDFNTDGGTAEADQTVNYNAKASKPVADPTKPGHTFAGWYTNSTLTTPFDFTATAIQANTTVYAKWTINQYTVAFNTDGGTTEANQTVNYDAKASKPVADPTKTGYTFAGWYANSTLTTPFDFTATAIQSNTTVYAKWTINQYTVDFNTDGGTAEADQTVNYNAKASKPVADPTKPGHTFAGWYTNSTLTTPFDFTATAIQANTTVYAKWTINQYTVAFNTDGGTTEANQTVNYDAKASKPVADPTKTGYTFAGWYANSTLTTPFDFTATAIQADTTVYAKWTINQYTVDFNTDGGTAVVDQTVNYDAKATKPAADPTKPGHTFAGWYTNSTLTTPFDFTATAIQANTTVYAKWTINPYTVAFNTDGGTAEANQTVNYNAKASKPVADPTKPGHTFAGWYANSTLTTPFDFTTTAIQAHTTVYAKWTINQYTVDFNTDGGTAVADQTVNYNAKATKPVADPTKPGHTFAGWYTNSTLTTPFDFTATAIQANTTVYAKWTINQYTVDFYTDGGTAVADQTVNYNAKASKPVADPTKPGHTFAGWYVNSTLTTPFDFTATAIQADTTVYAKWTINQYTVDFNTDGGTAVADQTVNYNAKATKPVADPTRTGYTFEGWYADSALTMPFDFTATVIESNTTIYANWTPIPHVPVTQPNQETDKYSIPINGLSVQATLTNAMTSDGRRTALVKLNEQSLTQALLKGGLHTTITFSLDEPVIQVELPSNALLALAEQSPNAVLTIEREGASYSLPVSILRDAPRDARVIVSIGEASEKERLQAANAAVGLQAKMLLDRPIEFKLLVNGKELNNFGGVYVDRTITLPGTADPLHTTAVWLDSHGKLQVVPTTLATHNGRTIVTIHVPHNSVYTIVHMDRTFADLQGHWAKSEVELLANRMIVNGMTANTFAPNNSITRAEFAALLVRALGLQETAPVQPYADVQASDWFYGAVGAAQNAGLITGTGNNTFQPGASITREQMVLMVARALQVGSDGQAAAANLSVLDQFADRTAIASWAQDAAAQALDAGIIQGMTASTFAPQATATRAQSAVMLKRLLQYLHFINE